MRRYIGLRPDDTDALAEYGEILATEGSDTDAYQILEKVLRRDTTRSKSRRTLVDVALRLKRYRDAREHLQGYLLAESPKDSELLGRLAESQIGMGEEEAAAKSLQSAIDAAPRELVHYRRLAELLGKRLGRAEDADACMQTLVEVNDNAEAHVMRGRYYLSAGRLEEAARCAARARELGPKDLAAVILASRCALRAKNYGKAEELLNEGIAMDPDAPVCRTLLAETAWAQGNSERAETLFREAATRAAPKEAAELLFALADVRIALEKYDEARDTIKELKANAEVSEETVDFLEARMLCADGRWHDASRRLEDLRAKVDPAAGLAAQIDLWLGRCYRHLGNSQKQLSAKERIPETSFSYRQARLEWAGSLMEDGRVDEAVAEYREIVSSSAASDSAWISFAQALVFQLHSTRSFDAADPEELVKVAKQLESPRSADRTTTHPPGVDTCRGR